MILAEQTSFDFYIIIRVSSLLKRDATSEVSREGRVGNLCDAHFLTRALLHVHTCKQVYQKKANVFPHLYKGNEITHSDTLPGFLILPYWVDPSFQLELF